MRNKKTIIIISLVSILISILIAILKKDFEIMSSVYEFPLSFVASGIDKLSNLGEIGNGIATMIWIGLASIPAIFAFAYGKKDETVFERIALFLLAGVTLISIYGMINPSAFLVASATGDIHMQEMVKVVWSLTTWEFLILYIVLRIIRLIRTGNKSQLLRTTSAVLYLVYAFIVCVFITSGIETITQLCQGTYNTSEQLFAIFKLLSQSVIYAFDLIITMRVLNLVELVKLDERDSIVEVAKKLSRISFIFLGIMTFISALVNLVQMLFARNLTNIEVVVDLPVDSLLFVIIMFLLSCLLIENKRLKDDNNLFI